MTDFSRAFIPVTIVLLTLSSGPLAAQTAGQVTPQGRVIVVSPEGEELTAAQRVRDEFMTVLRKYPPSVGQVLKLDPTLMASEQYLASYPGIVAFLNQHPEIRRSPAFYLERVSTGDGGYYYDPRERAWNNTIEMVGVFLIILTIAGALGWLIRTAVDYRRWGRLAKVQAEAHTKLLDRFTGNDELLAYVQSPAGAKFLKSSPITLDGAPRTMGAPLARIQWSMQAGIVLAAAGIGLNYVSQKIDPYRADPIFMFSVLLLSIGIGFLLSAGASFLMSRRLGLLEPSGEGEDA